MFDAGRDLAEWADALVVHSMAHPAVSAAEAAAKPFACVAFAPLFPTRDYPPMGAPRLGRLFHPLLWWVAAKAMDGVLGARVAVVRERAGLPPVKNVSTAVTERACAGLLAMSPALLPRPADFDEKIAVTGFWELHEGGTTSTVEEGLAAFLGAGDAPLFFTLGSMANLEPDRALEAAHAAIRAARALGMRAVVQLPEVEKLPPADDVFVTVRAPHAAVFPRCAVVVHHGGAGTTHAALRAGRPEVVVPHIADQFFWADLLYRRGVAPKPLPARTLDESGLTARVREARRPELQERAERLAREVERELGVESACAHVERAFSRVAKRN
jgi:sterol 3beta-glucosyltransferase/vancomycin aglycone glucosyltransferase